MRLIGTLEDERKAQIFSQFLHQKEIPHQIEIKKNTDWGSPSYGSNLCEIWLIEENYLKDVMKWFTLFNENPQDPIFNFPPLHHLSFPPKSNDLHQNFSQTRKTPSRNRWEKQAMGWVTSALLAICCILFMMSHFLFKPSVQIPARYAGLVLFTSPIEKTLLYDYPKFYQLIDHFVRLYGYEQLEHPDTLPVEGQRLLQQINQTSFWPGFYQLLLKEGWHEIENGFSEYPSFEKIQQGELWRLFSPCLLHADLFHIFFNMLWLIVLGKQIEQRLTPFRYILFILIIGIISNTAQYLTSGPNFIGFSGILCGMLAFIWMRQKYAAWEGYQLDRLTIIFMLVFIFSMAGIQVLSFFLHKSFDLAFSPNIANIAHLIGGAIGILFGRMNFFSWRQL